MPRAFGKISFSGFSDLSQVGYKLKSHQREMMSEREKERILSNRDVKEKIEHKNYAREIVLDITEMRKRVRRKLNIPEPVEYYRQEEEEKECITIDPKQVLYAEVHEVMCAQMGDENSTQTEKVNSEDEDEDPIERGLYRQIGSFLRVNSRSQYFDLFVRICTEKQGAEWCFQLRCTLESLISRDKKNIFPDYDKQIIESEIRKFSDRKNQRSACSFLFNISALAYITPERVLELIWQINLGTTMEAQMFGALRQCKQTIGTIGQNIERATRQAALFDAEETRQTIHSVREAADMANQTMANLDTNAINRAFEATSTVSEALQALINNCQLALAQVMDAKSHISAFVVERVKVFVGFCIKLVSYAAFLWKEWERLPISSVVMWSLAMWAQEMITFGSAIMTPFIEASKKVLCDFVKIRRCADQANQHEEFDMDAHVGEDDKCPLITSLIDVMRHIFSSDPNLKKKQFQVAKEKIVGVSAILKSADSIGKYFMHVITWLLENVREYLLQNGGDEPRFFSSDPIVQIMHRWYQIKKSDEYTRISVNRTLVMELESLQDELHSFQMHKCKGYSAAFNNLKLLLVRSTMKEIDEALERVPAQLKRAKSKRPTRPLWIHITGPPGIGKTSFLQPTIVTGLMARMFPDFHFENPDALCYKRKAGVDYWEGYFDHPVVVYDDIFQVFQNDQAMYMTIEELTDICNDGLVNLNMAFARKGTAFFNSPIVLSTGNMDFMKLGAVNDKCVSGGVHIHQRRDFVLDIKPNGKYFKNRTMNLPDDFKLKYETGTMYDGYPDDLYLFTVTDGEGRELKKGAWKPVMEWMLNAAAEKAVHRRSVGNCVEDQLRNYSRWVRDEKQFLEEYEVEAPWAESHQFRMFGRNKRSKGVGTSPVRKKDAVLDMNHSKMSKNTQVGTDHIDRDGFSATRFDRDGYQTVSRRRQATQALGIKMTCENLEAQMFSRPEYWRVVKGETWGTYRDRMYGIHHVVVLGECMESEDMGRMYLAQYLDSRLVDRELTEGKMADYVRQLQSLKDLPFIQRLHAAQELKERIIKAEMEPVSSGWFDWAKVKGVKTEPFDKLYTLYVKSSNVELSPMSKALVVVISTIIAGMAGFAIYKTLFSSNIEAHSFNEQNESTHDVVADAICKWIMYTKKDDELINVAGINALAVGGSVFAIPGHFFTRAKEIAEAFEVVFEVKFSKTESKLVPFDNVEAIDMGEDRDLMFLNVPNLVNRRHIAKHFMPDRKECDLSECYLYGFRTSRMGEALTPCIVNVSRTKTKGNIQYKLGEIMHRDRRWDSKTVQSVSGYHYGGVTMLKGDCGMVLLHCDSTVPEKVLGFHTAGGPSVGYSERITREDIDAAIKYFKDEYIEEEYAVKKEPSTLEIKYPSALDALRVRGKATTVQTPIGEASMVINVPQKSKVRKSFLAQYVEDDIGMSEYAPAALRPLEVQGQMISPLAKGIAKMANSGNQVKNELLNDIVVHVSETLEQFGRSREERRELTLDESINGKDNLRQIDITTSAGFPYSALFPTQGKRPWFEATSVEDGVHFQPTQEVVDMVEERVSKAKQGVAVKTVFIATLKDETRPLMKVQSGDTRIFQVGPMDLSLALRKMCGMFIADMSRHPVESEIAVGINCESEQWDMLYRRLTRVGKNFLAGDYSKFDSTLTKQIGMAVCEVVNRYYNDSEENKLARRTMFKQMFSSTQVAHDVVFKCDQGNPSGDAMTTIINCIANMILFRLAYVSITKKDVSTYNEHVCGTVYGDDHVLGVSDAARDEGFNMINVARYLQSVGLVYTTTSKGAIEKEFVEEKDLMYLQRTWRYDEKIGLYTARMEPNEILQTLVWIRTDPYNMDDMIARCNSVLQMFAAHGLPTFRAIRKWIEKWNDLMMDEHGVRMDLSKLLTFAAIRKTQYGNRTALDSQMIEASLSDSDLKTQATWASTKIRRVKQTRGVNAGKRHIRSIKRAHLECQMDQEDFEQMINEMHHMQVPTDDDGFDEPTPHDFSTHWSNQFATQTVDNETSDIELDTVDMPLDSINLGPILGLVEPPVSVHMVKCFVGSYPPAPVEKHLFPFKLVDHKGSFEYDSELWDYTFEELDVNLPECPRKKAILKMKAWQEIMFNRLQQIRPTEYEFNRETVMYQMNLDTPYFWTAWYYVCYPQQAICPFAPDNYSGFLAMYADYITKKMNEHLWGEEEGSVQWVINRHVFARYEAHHFPIQPFWIDSWTTEVFEPEDEQLLEAQMETQVQLTKFSDEAPPHVAENDVQGKWMPNQQDMFVSDNNFKRPLPLLNTTWTAAMTEGTLLGSIILPNDWITYAEGTGDPFIGKKLSKWAFIRAEFKVRVQINGTPQHYGTILASWIPFGAYTSPAYTGYHSQWSNKNWIQVDARDQSAILYVPWMDIVDKRSVFEVSSTATPGYIQPMSVYFYVAAPLRMVTGTATPIGVTVFVEAENVVVSNYTNRIHPEAPIIEEEMEAQMDIYGSGGGMLADDPGPVQEEAKVKTESSKVVSRTVSAVGNAMLAFQGLPYVGSFATIGGFLTKAGGAVLDWMGFSVPPNLENTKPMQIRQPLFHKSEDSPLSVVMTHRADAALLNDYALVHDTPEANSVLKFCMEPGLWTMTDWTAAQTTGTVIASFSMAPQFMGRVVPPNTYPTPVMKMSQFAAFWRGGFRIVVRVIASAFHSGRFRITYDPLTAITSGSINNNDANFVVNELVDVSNRREVKFVIPYDSQFMAKLTSNTTRDRTNIGRMNFIVVNPLSSPSTTVNPVSIQVFVMASTDFQLFQPTLQNFSLSSVTTEMEAQMDVPDMYPKERCEMETTSSECLRNAKFNMMGTGKAWRANKVSQAAEIVSIRDLTNMLSLIGQAPFVAATPTTTVAVDMGGVTTVSTFAARNCYYVAMRTLFQFYRGGMRYVLAGQEQVNGFATIIPNAPAYSSTGLFEVTFSSSLLSQMAPTYSSCHFLSARVGLTPVDVTLPYNAQTKCDINRNFISSSIPSQERTKMLVHYATSYGSPVPVTNIYSSLLQYCGGGDDFILGYRLPIYPQTHVSPTEPLDQVAIDLDLSESEQDLLY